MTLANQMPMNNIYTQRPSSRGKSKQTNKQTENSLKTKQLLEFEQLPSVHSIKRRRGADLAFLPGKQLSPSTTVQCQNHMHVKRWF